MNGDVVEQGGTAHIENTALYLLTSKLVRDEWEKLRREKITPWAFLNSAKPMRVVDFYGREISYAGVHFEGSPRLVFWGRFLEPFLEDIALRTIERTVTLCRDEGHELKSALIETASLLKGLVRSAFDAMADVDQRLRGRGYPDRIAKRNVDGEVASVGRFIDARVTALTKDKPNPMSPTFVIQAADVLSQGLTGQEIIRATTAYAAQYNVHLPHSSHPFQAANKRTALSDNLLAFPDAQRYQIIRALCENEAVLEVNRNSARTLKIQLLTRYAYLNDEPSDPGIAESLTEQTRHWLDSFPVALGLYNGALEKHRNRAFTRNLLDDLRLCLEKVLQELLQNDKRLEKQVEHIGRFIKERGGSTEFRNMFERLLDYYCKYQNAHVKHDDAVIEEEVDFVIEVTSSFLKHIVRVAGRDAR